MAFITDILNTIKNARKGKDMRQAIYDGIQQCYKDATGHPDSVAAVVERLKIEKGRIDELATSQTFTGNYTQSNLVFHAYRNATTGNPDPDDSYNYEGTSGKHEMPICKIFQEGTLDFAEKQSNEKVKILKEGLYIFELRIFISGSGKLDIEARINDVSQRYNAWQIVAQSTEETKIIAYILYLKGDDVVSFYGTPGLQASVRAPVSDVNCYVLDWIGKAQISDCSKEISDIRVGEDGAVYGTAGEAVRKQIGNITEDIGNLNKEKLDSDVVYEVGDDGEIVSSTKMMDISGNGEIAKISADSVYKDNIIPLPNIAEKTVNGLTYSAKDGIISLNGTATTYTLIDLGVNLSMMDGLSAIGYKIFILDGTLPSGTSIILGLSFDGYAQTLTNTVQEKKSSSLITFNNKNISISINNNTAINVKFGVVVIPINDIPSKFNVGKKYAGYMLNQLICTNNMWAFGTNISKIKLAQYYRFRKNKLYGKSLFVAGDSVAFGFGSGGKSYADIIAEKNKMSMKKVAVSGTTIAKRDGMANSILEQVQMMDKLYDYVLIEGGFNDYFQKDKGVSIGTMPKNMNSRRDDKTTYGALDSICLWLKQNYPASKILFVVPHKIMTITGVIDSEFYPYLQAIRDVCEKYSISYADIALKGGCTPFYQEFRDTYFSDDGIHPNLEGYETFYVPRIEAEMEML